MAESSGVCRPDGNADRDDEKHVVLEAKHKIFLSHSGAEKHFVENLCNELERCLRYPFFDLREHCLPKGENFPKHIFDAIGQCHLGVVILSDEFLSSKWPMMELVAMVEEAEKRKSSFKIIPVFLRTSLVDFDDPKNQQKWRKCWEELALKYPKRVEVEKCEGALEYIRPLNSLVNGGLCDSEFLNVIVDFICGEVDAEIRLEEGNIAGRNRLCKVIQDKMNLQQEGQSNGVCMVGLYGMGGMGKTTICKALCNDFFTKFQGRVYHAELGKVSEEELLRNVLKKLSNTHQEYLIGFNKDERGFHLEAL